MSSDETKVWGGSGPIRRSTIQIVLVDIACYHCRHLVTYRQSLANTPLEITGCNAYHWHVNPIQTSTEPRHGCFQVCHVNRVRRPAHHCQTASLDKAFRLMPAPQVHQGISAHDEITVVAIRAPLTPEQANGVYRVMRTSAVNVYGGDIKSGVVTDGHSDHHQPVFDGNRGVILLVRWDFRRSEKHPIKAKGDTYFFCRQQMPEVNRIKSAAKYTEPQVTNSCVCVVWCSSRGQEFCLIVITGRSGGSIDARSIPASI